MGNPEQPRDDRGRYARVSGATVAVTAVLVSSVVYGSAGGSAGGGAASVESSLGQVTRVKVDNAKRSAAKGRRATTWQRLGLKQIKEQLTRGGRCAANSYGDVQRFFRRTPCRSLDRMLFVLGDEAGNRMVVSVSWVEMRTPGAARSLRDLADVYGTGNVAPLPGFVVGAGDIRWTGRNYDSRRSRRLVVIGEVEPLRGSPDRDFMDGVAEVVAQFPRP